MPENVLYFHGSLKEYIRIDLRDLIDIENNFRNINDIRDIFKEQMKPNLNFEKELFVINPPSRILIDRLSKIYGYRKEDYVEARIQGKRAYKCHNVRLIKAIADEVNLDEL